MPMPSAETLREAQAEIARTRADLAFLDRASGEGEIIFCDTGAEGRARQIAAAINEARALLVQSEEASR